MVRSKIITLAVCLASSLIVIAGNAHASSSTSPERQSTPVDRDFGQHDACFGDKYESDDDLKTGNEISIEEVLKLLDTPGS